MTLKRFGVSLENDLLEKLDEFVERKMFPNRSQAIRHLIHKNTVEEQWENDELVAGAIVLIYDHNLRELHEKVNALQHEYNCLTIAGQHIHLDSNHTLEVITVKGKSSKLTKLANKLTAIKGVKHGELVKTGID
ncbi:MAG: nickel-responsive transcriptional regulator NikR [Bacteroidales bacterium]|nr:nickel-responsive transcriptional regulator NikR [Bacteroidales bacterium]MCF8390510.1 nickel-responsive transcriptional regulator NikR [Bacteroidales bacterium]